VKASHFDRASKYLTDLYDRGEAEADRRERAHRGDVADLTEEL
jgi:hypothetical protein